MVFRRFLLKILLYLILLSFLGAFTVWSFSQNNLVASPFIMLGIWIILAIFFIRAILQALDPMEKFLKTLSTDDLVNLPARRHLLSREINQAYQHIHSIIQRIKIEKEKQFHLYQTSIDQSGSGLMVYNTQGEIKLINKTARSLFDDKLFSNIQKLVVFNTELPELLTNENPDNALIKYQVGNKLKKVSIHLKDFKLQDENLRIASLQDISEELEREELLAWKKLLHVLTHEIMNSVTPMKTLSYSLYHSFFQTEAHEKKSVLEISQDKATDLRDGLEAINTRITGMMNFVESFRKLYKIPEPNFKENTLGSILQEIEKIMLPEFQRNQISFNVSGNQNFNILCDREMIIQILINLLKNAIVAIHEKKEPEIHIVVYRNQRETHIEIQDNGVGMNDEELSNCFVPFYTTKSDGNGIGLYYSRLLALIHKGNLTASSSQGKGATFTLTI